MKLRGGKKEGQMELGLGTILGAAGMLAVAVSLATSCTIGTFNYGKLSQQVQAQQVHVDKIPVLATDMTWVKEQLKTIAGVLGAAAPTAKE